MWPKKKNAEKHPPKSVVALDLEEKVQKLIT